jgi:ABC-2 type transport system ATP-binding protein
MKNQYVIETDNLTKKYGNLIAVNEVNMRVKKGSIYGLIGRNGAGKTTIMKMICGLSAKSNGHIKLFGEEDTDNNIVYRRMGALIETPGIYPGMSAYDNMKCRAICLGITDYDSNIKELLELVSLPTTILRPVKKFSLGMKQRLGIALALLGNPDLLVLDEPINGLDPQGIAEIRETLVKLNKEKKITILISSHILEELSKIVTDYGIIKDGRLIEEISREELMEKCMERIELKTNNSDKATTVIEKMGITNYKVVDKDTIHIYECLDNLGEINKMLVNNDILVTSMKINSESIESYFIELTGK